MTEIKSLEDLMEIRDEIRDKMKLIMLKNPSTVQHAANIGISWHTLNKFRKGYGLQNKALLKIYNYLKTNGY